MDGKGLIKPYPAYGCLGLFREGKPGSVLVTHQAGRGLEREAEVISPSSGSPDTVVQPGEALPFLTLFSPSAKGGHSALCLLRTPTTTTCRGPRVPEALEHAGTPPS